MSKKSQAQMQDVAGRQPDEMLVARAQAGDMAAEEALVRKYMGTVKQKARLYYMAGADEEDVVQEGMIGLFKAIHQYDPDKNAAFRTFAGICITRQIISAIRSAARKKYQMLNNSLSLYDPVIQDNDSVLLGDTVKDISAVDPETMYMLTDIVNYIIHNEDKLFSDLEMRVLTELLRGRNVDAIALKLGRNPKSVDNAVRRAKKKIAEYISA